MFPAAYEVTAAAASRTSQRRNPTRETASQHTAAGTRQSQDPKPAVNDRAQAVAAQSQTARVGDHEQPHRPHQPNTKRHACAQPHLTPSG